MYQAIVFYEKKKKKKITRNKNLIIFGERKQLLTNIKIRKANIKIKIIIKKQRY